ncbi:hypothetical protein GWK47_006111 [Chionoecetes opilio]|uniref:HAT C-terminal dimerisation domain-containing protein n=1 Tax=Chionoecetes opilio TaxID=41210 RepID=A0A8J4YFE1_CHIOP|nr:hypothetical protein GWK47_006111 [Chionoecetes opilio]
MVREAYIGLLLPILSVHWDSLRALKAKPLIYARPLLEYLLENPHSDKRLKCFKARFLSLSDQMDFLMATAIHTLFKLPVVRFLNPAKVTEQAVLDTSEGTSPDEDEEDDIFKAMFPALSIAAWVDVFVNNNMAIPSSAAVERLFSKGSDITRAKRASLTSNHFERLVFMKGNMDLLKMKLSPEDSE